MTPADPPSAVTPSARDAVVDAGIDLLLRDGLGHGAERISLDRAAAHAGVARATAYRLWKHATVRPQEAFQTALLCRLAEYVVDHDTEAVAAGDAVGAVLHGLASSEPLTAGERWWALVELVRVATRANLLDRHGRPMLRMRAGLLAAAATHAEDGELPDTEQRELFDALRTAAARSLERFIPQYVAIAEVFGLRVRAGYRLEQFALLAACVVEGLAMRLPFAADEVIGVDTPYRDRGGDWTLFGVAMMGLIREFYESDPDSPHPFVFPAGPGAFAGVVDPTRPTPG